MIRLLKQSDKELIFEYLDRNEIETSFLYANIVEFGVENKREIRRCADYYGYFCGDTLKGILPFYNLGSCIPHFEVDDAIPFFSDLMKEQNFEFLLGMRKIVKPLYDNIKGYKEVLSYDESSYFVNRKFKPFIVESLTFIDAKEESIDKVLDFVVYAREHGFQQVITREEVIRTLAQRGDEEDFIIGLKDGKMVSQACIQTYTEKINQIGSVYTVEEERGKGYCKAVVSELCKRIIGRGKYPTLSVKKNNTPAVKAYTALGFEHYDDYLIVKLEK